MLYYFVILSLTARAESAQIPTPESHRCTRVKMGAEGEYESSFTCVSFDADDDMNSQFSCTPDGLPAGGDGEVVKGVESITEGTVSLHPWH